MIDATGNIPDPGPKVNASFKHGAAKRSGVTREYAAWRSARSRCRNRKAKQSKDYVGRGIEFSPQWNDFNTFLKDVGPCPSRHHTIERINNNLGYVPGNVRWATRREQSNNTRRNITFEVNGVRKTIAEWARFMGVKYMTVYGRFKLGWSPYDIVTIPIGPAHN